MPLIVAGIVFLSVFVSAVGLYWRMRREPSPPAAPAQAPAAAPYYIATPFDAPPAPRPPAPVAKRSVRNSWWPQIHDAKSARTAAKQGMWASFGCAGATALVSFLSGSGMPLIEGVGPNAWVDAALFAILGMGIGRMSRAAAVGGLVLYIVERVAMSRTAGFVVGFSPLMFVAICACFIHGVRGTFAFRRYRAVVQVSDWGPADNAQHLL